MPDHTLSQPRQLRRHVELVGRKLPKRNTIESYDRCAHCRAFLDALHRYPQFHADILQTARECHAACSPPHPALITSARMMLLHRYQGIDRRWCETGSRAFSAAIKAALMESGSWDVFERVFVDRALHPESHPETPSIHIELSGWPQGLSTLVGNKADVEPSNDHVDVLLFTMKIPASLTPAEVSVLFEKVMRDTNVTRHLRRPEGTRSRGPRRGYLTDVDLYTKLERHRQEGGTKASFIRAITAKQIVIDGWGQGPPLPDSIDRRIGQTRWLAPAQASWWDNQYEEVLAGKISLASIPRAS